MAKNTTDKRLTLDSDEPSLLFAINDLLATGGIDFDEWWKEFSKPPSGKNKKQLDAWTKPKLIETTPSTIKNIGRWFRYYPDKDDESTFYDLSGTSRDLIFHINAIAYQQGKENESVSSKNGKPLLKGYPRIKLLFYTKDGVRAEKGIRAVGFTDDANIVKRGLAKAINSTDLLSWAKKIKTIFGDTNYCWKKGTECVSYSGQIARLQGLENWALVTNKAEGVKLFTSMLKIFDATPDLDGFNLSNKTNKSQFTKVETTTVLGKKVKLDSERPVVDCYFYSAVLQLPLLKKPIPLVIRNAIVYK
ncbi:hypothetical protein [Microcoleus sp. B4-C1]|uniref:hypothetical protein n=1 Tax=Microcoleus sp. B4-C1 TaxID=2818660 RepID=UPI002FD2C59E